MLAVVEALYAKGRLRLDLVTFPPASGHDRALASASDNARREWGPFPRSDDVPASNTTAPPPPGANAALRGALDTVFEEARRRVRVAKVDQLEEAAKDSKFDFALVTTAWTSWDIDGAQSLWSVRLLTPAFTPTREWIVILNLLKVILDSEHTTRFGAHRFAHNEEVRAIVFAKIGKMGTAKQGPT